MATKSAAQVVRTVVVCCLLGGVIGTPQQDILDEHNAWRSEVGSPALTWDADIAAVAQEWADHLRDNQDCDLEHRSISDLSSKYSAGLLGENLYNSWTSQSTLSKTGIDAVSAWASEKADYNYGPQGDACTKKSTAAVGHYTQVTWHESAKVGCGWATCSPARGGTSGVWVCNYYPAGNYVNQYPFCEANVPTGMTKCTTISATGQPACGTKCGSCPDVSDCCSCTIDDTCKADADPAAVAGTPAPETTPTIPSSAARLYGGWGVVVGAAGLVGFALFPQF